MKKWIFGLVFMLLFVSGCQNTVNLSVVNSGITPAAQALSVGAAGLTVNSVTITEGIIVLAEIELELSEVEGEENEEDEIDFIGPYIIDITGTTPQLLEEISIPAGTYKEIELELKKVEDEDDDAENYDAKYLGYNVYLEGYVNGISTQTFVFTSNIDEEIEIEGNFTIAGGGLLGFLGGNSSILIAFDSSQWFTSGATFYDPRDAENAEAIKELIKSSLDADNDEDEDGELDKEEDEEEDEEED